MKTSLYTILFSLFAFVATAQDTDVVDDLKFYADIMANAGNPIHKQRAHDQFYQIFDQWINSSEYDDATLESIQWLSVKSPEDESFKIVTWPLSKGENDNSYYGYLIRNNKKYKLKAATMLDDMEYDVLSVDDWVGVMYYNIHSVEKDSKTHYILFGVDKHENYENRKVADVLTFENDVPVFGAELFKKQDPGERGVIKNRLVLDYASDSNVSLNYNPNIGMIVFDHLIARMGRISGQGATMLPDGSYVGYKWDGTHFNYVDKIYNQTQAEAPFPKPVLGKSNNDIFGQGAKKKKKRN